MKKTTVEITASDGENVTLSADTAIVFTLDNMEKITGNSGKVAITSGISCVGKKIPEHVLSKIIASLVISFIEKIEDTPLLAAFNLNNIAEILEKRSDEILETATFEDKKAALDTAFNNIVKEFLGR